MGNINRVSQNPQNEFCFSERLPLPCFEKVFSYHIQIRKIKYTLAAVKSCDRFVFNTRVFGGAGINATC